MVTISRPLIRDFITRFPLSATALNRWYEITKRSDWSNFNDVKKTWNHCHSIGNDRYTFEIAGNSYSLIALIHFKRRILYIRKILTYHEYTELCKKDAVKYPLRNLKIL